MNYFARKNAKLAKLNYMLCCTYCKYVSSSRFKRNIVPMRMLTSKQMKNIPYAISYATEAFTLQISLCSKKSESDI